MCALKISDLTVEKMFGRKVRQGSYVTICDSVLRTEDDALRVSYEPGRVFWKIDLTEGTKVKLFDERCWHNIDALMIERAKEFVSFNTGKDCFIPLFDQFSGYGYQIKASFGCARVSIQGSQLRDGSEAILRVMSALKGLDVSLLQFIKSADSLELLIEERNVSAVLAALAKKFTVIERQI